VKSFGDDHDCRDGRADGWCRVARDVCRVGLRGVGGGGGRVYRPRPGPGPPKGPCP